ncbi:putative membrane protein [Actinomadura hallensis]|uniref:Putative membrane protein n=1 Tax=Actinomadura hallensis TaxID=337895 RepID=A0A543ILZ0_9ACTN|nr:PH domain-containing protein [Actinomadura hallensis]TQM71606.1 putative membrane protein [Actinomadura hallensis]
MSEWRRLHPRVIWVDLVRSVLSLLPAVTAIAVFGVDPGAGSLWPLLAVAAAGVLGAAGDAVRWAFTRYRITPSYVERKTGVLVRAHRSIQRDRIRSVDVEGRLRHRLAGLRVVKIGAGQQSAAGESALSLDAVSVAEAESLQRLLLRADAPDAKDAPDTEVPADAGAATEAEAPAGAETGADGPAEVYARFQPGWFVYNMFNVWAYVFAIGVGWGAYWLLTGFGVDVGGFVAGLVSSDGIGWFWTSVLAVLALGAFGAAGLALNYFVEYWGFELARVPGEKGTLLRTRQGLFTTRTVNRDDNRMRGVRLSEPVLWRWLGVTDTQVITTGLSLWSMSQPTAILPRGPRRAALRVAAAALGADPDPLRADLERHPGAALRRRLAWATAATAAAALLLGWLAAAGVVPASTLWAAAALWPVALVAAVVAYRALGHAIAGEYLVARSGLVNRSTVVLRRSAVSTIAVRESLLQRRLGLRTVSVMTAAGTGGYTVPDLAADESLRFADRAAPGLLGPFLRPRDADEPA